MIRTRPRVLRLLLAAALAAGPAPVLAQDALEPGNWRLRVSGSTNGVPNPVEDSEQCLEGEQLKDLGAYFAPSLEGGQADCQRTRQPSAEPGKVDYRMHCTGAGFTVDATTSVTVESPHRFTGLLRVDSRTETESAVVLADVEGTWLGACRPTPAPASGVAPAP
jgi:hypothetical protein